MKTKEWYENYAKETGLDLGDSFEKILKALEKTDSHCPCKYAIWKKTKPDELEKIICPCEDHLKEIEELGHCHCRMFCKKGY